MFIYCAYNYLLLASISYTLFFLLWIWMFGNSPNTFFFTFLIFMVIGSFSFESVTFFFFFTLRSASVSVDISVPPVAGFNNYMLLGCWSSQPPKFFYFFFFFLPLVLSSGLSSSTTCSSKPFFFYWAASNASILACAFFYYLSLIKFCLSSIAWSLNLSFSFACISSNYFCSIISICISFILIISYFLGSSNQEYDIIFLLWANQMPLRKSCPTQSRSRGVIWMSDLWSLISYLWFTFSESSTAFIQFYLGFLKCSDP